VVLNIKLFTIHSGAFGTLNIFIMFVLCGFICLQFKAISQAYEVLADPKKRDLYDRGGEQAIKEGGIASEMHNPMDIFDMFFGGGSRSRSPSKGKDVIHQLKVSLEDLYNGSVRKLALQKNVICASCEGLCSSTVYYSS